MKIKGLISIIVIFLVIAGFNLGKALANQNWLVIVNSSNPITSTSKEEIKKWFLKKKTMWENNHPIIPVDQSASSAVYQEFSKDVLGKNVGALKRYWQKMIFSGRAVPPMEKASDKEVIEYIKSNPDAVGYVSKDANTNGVKVLKIE